jgi:TrmH family RNA methyltransferase
LRGGVGESALHEREVDRSNLRVVLCQPRNPLNIGAAARAIANFGCNSLRLVDPYDAAFREAVSAVGGAAVLRAAEVYAQVADAVADCSLVVGTTSVGNRELQHPLLGLEAAGPLIRAASARGPVAILFGSEKFGLTNEEMSHCHWLMRIPTVDDTPSMNLGQAVAVSLYEVVRESQEVCWPGKKKMRATDAEHLSNMLLEVLEESGYTNRIIATSTDQKIRRFLRRVDFGARDAPLLLGILRQVLWKFRSRD